MPYPINARLFCFVKRMPEVFNRSFKVVLVEPALNLHLGRGSLDDEPMIHDLMIIYII